MSSDVASGTVERKEKVVNSQTRGKITIDGKEAINFGSFDFLGLLGEDLIQASQFTTYFHFIQMCIPLQLCLNHSNAGRMREIYPQVRSGRLRPARVLRHHRRCAALIPPYSYVPHPSRASRIFTASACCAIPRSSTTLPTEPQCTWSSRRTWPPLWAPRPA